MAFRWAACLCAAAALTTRAAASQIDGGSPAKLYSGSVLLNSAEDVDAVLQALVGDGAVVVSGALRIQGSSLSDAVLEPLLSRVVKVGGPVSITDTGAGVTRVALPRLASVGGSITLRRSKGVGSLCDMPQLRRHMVQGGVTVMDNDNVINLPSDFHEGPGFRSAADVAIGCDAAALAGNARLDAGAGDGLARERVAVTYVRGRRATNESTAAGNATVTEETKSVAADGGALEADTKPQAVNVAEAVPPGTVSIIWVSAGNAAKSGELAECDAEAAAGEDDAGMAGRGNEDDSGGDDGGLGGGAIAGIIIGVLVLICVVVGVVLFILARNDKIDLDFTSFTDACKEKMECGCCKGSGHTISTPARTSRGKTGTAARGGTRGAKARTVGRPRPGARPARTSKAGVVNKSYEHTKIKKEPKEPKFNSLTPEVPKTSYDDDGGYIENSDDDDDMYETVKETDMGKPPAVPKRGRADTNFDI